MDHQKLSRLLLGAAALALAAVFVIRLASGVNLITAGLWLAAAVLVGIIAAALKPQEDKARNSVIGSGIALVLSLMVLSFVAGRVTAPATREYDTAAPATLTEEAGDSTAEPTVSGTAEPTPLPHISWTEEHYVDDFNDPTDETYLRGRFVGTFSNSATSGSLLNAFLYFDKDLPGHKDDSFHIRLFEYGDNVVEFYHTELYEVTIKIKIDGKTYQAHPDRITEKNIYVKRGSAIFEPIIRALNQEKDIAVVITVSDGLTDTYRFDIDPYGLEGLSHNWK